MGKQKYTFPGPTCPGCQYHQTVGEAVGQTRYCNGFPKRRKSKRFKRSDPKYKPPKWCPRRISPPVCRIYGFVNPENKYLDWQLNRKNYKPGACIIPQPSRYWLRLEVPLGKTAKQFYDAAQLEPLSNIFSSYGAQVGPGEIVEIDDGLKPYYFYCADGYADLRDGDDSLEQSEGEAAKKLPSFPALSRDVFQSFYSLMPRKNDNDLLSTAARKFNGPILEYITQSEDYPTLKAVCEGRELTAYEAASEFVARTAEELDSLLSNISGEKNALNTLEKLENAEQEARKELAGLLERMRAVKERSLGLEQSVVDAANQAESKHRQVEAVGKLVDASTAKNEDDVAAVVAMAVNAAAEKAEEVQSIIGAWSDEPGNMVKNEANAELLALVRKSPVLWDISKYLGRFREIFAQGKRNGYAYGRGEKYSLELGRDLSRALTSELAMLASPQTTPLFLRKYQRGQIKQYQRREPIYKGMGDIICCLDESDSTEGDPAAWGKAVALTLLEIAADNGRRFALIHFSGPGSFKTEVFRPGGYAMAEKVEAAETFLGGGTDFQTPMNDALRLMDEEDLENADIIFITDGECALPDAYVERLRSEQANRRFTVTGVLLDKGSPGMTFSLEKFCQNIYRTSELLGDEIVRELVRSRV